MEPTLKLAHKYFNFHHIGAHHLPVNIWPEVVFMIKKNGFYTRYLAVGPEVVVIKELIWQEYFQSFLVDEKK